MIVSNYLTECIDNSIEREGGRETEKDVFYFNESKDITNYIFFPFKINFLKIR